MILDQINNWQLYNIGPVWQKAFSFLTTLSSDIEEGKHEIQGDEIYAMVVGYETKFPEQAVLEAHRNYADIQILLSGREKMLWFPTRQLQSKEDYNPAKDVQYFYPSTNHPAQLVLQPGLFVLYLPDDAHMPELTVGQQPEIVKKVVIKAHVNLFPTP
jgi:YhcH/YjgK/YiaL family protein